MELKAAIEALKYLKEPCRVELYSDSAYLVNAFTQNWIGKWKQNGWRRKESEEVKNIDLWKELDKLNERHNIEWIKVKGIVIMNTIIGVTSLQRIKLKDTAEC